VPFHFFGLGQGGPCPYFAPNNNENVFLGHIFTNLYIKLLMLLWVGILGLTRRPKSSLGTRKPSPNKWTLTRTMSQLIYLILKK
jgi:hypothetical protein